MFIIDTIFRTPKRKLTRMADLLVRPEMMGKIDIYPVRIINSARE